MFCYKGKDHFFTIMIVARITYLCGNNVHKDIAIPSLTVPVLVFLITNNSNSEQETGRLLVQ